MYGQPLTAECAMEMALEELESYKEEVEIKKTAMINTIRMLHNESMITDDAVAILLKGM